MLPICKSILIYFNIIKVLHSKPKENYVSPCRMEDGKTFLPVFLIFAFILIYSRINLFDSGLPPVHLCAVAPVLAIRIYGLR